ncbi:MAG: tetratricopeptide repeat protein [Planctomycetes bacterium]|nr:tetratricopeptide repeat protein [Planctomycetota bacterium]
MSRKGRSIVAFAILSITIIANLNTPSAAAFEEPAEINIALRGRDYSKAIKLIKDALRANPKDDAKEFLHFRLALAHQYSGKLEEAITAFEGQTRLFPTGSWANKARMHIADAHVALKHYEAAEKIYAARVAELVSDDRKADIAKVYLNFAEDYFAPKDSLIQPNYERARTFYEKALELEPAGALRETVLYKRALCNQKLGQYGPVAGQFEAYLIEFDPAYRETKRMRAGEKPLPEKAVEGGASWIEARLGLGECRLLLSEWQESRRVLQDLAHSLEKSEANADLEKSKAGRRTEAWIKTKSLIAGTYRFPTPPDVPNLNSGVKVLDELIDKHPSSIEAVRAASDIAVAFRHRGWSDAAIEAFRALIDRKRIRPESDETLKLAETLSQSALYQVGELLLAQRKYADAIGTWNQYVAKFPNGPQWSAAQQAIIDTEYAIGADAKSDDRFDDARQAWTRFLEKYPLDGRATGILFAFGEMAYIEQEKREKAGKTPDWTDAIAAWKRLVEKSPGGEDAGRAQLRIGQTLEEKVKDLDAAIEAYQKLNWSGMSSLAQQRLREMRSVRLEVATERTYRTNEPAKVRVNVRNIDKLTVKMYRIDMEDYYRKSRTIGGVERLDLMLIDPDKTFDIDVKDYAAYKPITQEIEIPNEGARTWAVYVSNEKSTAEEKNPANAGSTVKPTRLQATTLVVASDIEILVKSSRGQVLVFAQDMRTMQPAKGVQILVADQSSVFLEGRTGDDGFWLSTDKKIKSAQGLSVFANRGGAVAGTGLSLAGLSFAQGLAPRGFIHTDRPAYRPGDSVNFRGILREVTDGAYVLPTNPEDKRLRWKLDVIDAKGRTLHSDEIVLTDYGTFSALFRVSGDAPVGKYKIIARRVDGPSFEGGFSVETYQLAKAVLSFDLKDRVVMRGDRVSGSIVAKYHYGEAVIDKDIEYELHYPNGDVERRTGKTDSAGKVAVEFETTMLPEEGVVQIVARQAELNIGVVDAVYVAVRDFTASLSTVRPLYLSEEPVEAKIETLAI